MSVRVQIRTSDAAWADRHATPADAGRVAVVVSDAEEVQFAGRAWFRFDMRKVASVLPKDWQSPWGMCPAEWASAL